MIASQISEEFAQTRCLSSDKLCLKAHEHFTPMPGWRNSQRLAYRQPQQLLFTQGNIMFDHLPPPSLYIPTCSTIPGKKDVFDILICSSRRSQYCSTPTPPNVSFLQQILSSFNTTPPTGSLTLYIGSDSHHPDSFVSPFYSEEKLISGLGFHPTTSFDLPLFLPGVWKETTIQLAKEEDVSRSSFRSGETWLDKRHWGKKTAVSLPLLKTQRFWIKISWNELTCKTFTHPLLRYTAESQNHNKNLQEHKRRVAFIYLNIKHSVAYFTTCSIFMTLGWCVVRWTDGFSVRLFLGEVECVTKEKSQRIQKMAVKHTDKNM